MRMLKRSALLGLVAGGALALAACGGGDSDDDSPDPTETAEPTAAATDAPDNGGGGGGGGDGLVQGKDPGEYYTLNCSACHGAGRVGISGLGLPLTPDVLSEDDAFYFDTIKNGRDGTVMPKWGEAGLSDDDINALVAFIRTAP